jgi:hypothetical protein
MRVGMSVDNLKERKKERMRKKRNEDERMREINSKGTFES